MIIPDTNLLLYAYIPSFREHKAAKNWLEETLNNGSELLGLAWQVITSYIRIGTNPKLFKVPVEIHEIESQLKMLISHPLVQIINPQSGHLDHFIDLIKKEQITADLVMDAHLAALALENKAQLATTDRDFSRFRKLKYYNPLSGRI